jgi:hypothetical protein
MNHREQMRRRLRDRGLDRPESRESSIDGLPASIELRIEQLVLEGVEGADRNRIADAVQSELARLLTEQGVPSNLHAPAKAGHIDAGTIHIDSGARAAGVGERIAQAIYGSIGAATNSAGRTPRS